MSRTLFSLAGFQVIISGRFWGSGITGMAGFAAPKSVITSLAGFGSHRLQQDISGRLHGSAPLFLRQ
jgi:hypothetical protein